MSATPLTTKEEAFAQARAAGATQIEAYQMSYATSATTAPATMRSEASKIEGRVRVSERIAVLREQMSAKVVDAIGEEAAYEREHAMAELHRALVMAEKLVNPGDMVKAILGKCKVSGLLVEDRKNRRGPFDDLDADRARAARVAVREALDRAKKKAAASE